MPTTLTFPSELPISAHAQTIADALRDSPVIIVCGDTGSGKTTQLPKIALLAGRGRGNRMIGCTQPRRLAALAMARRVAEEFGEEPGGRVGYQHRFDKKLSRDTVVKFMTDGILLAETRRDRLLLAYDTLIIDEAHERSLNIDFLLGILKRILPRRPDLKIIISSATLDVERFSVFFQTAPIISVPGRLYPIETRWRPPESEDDTDLPRQIANAVDEISTEGPGDILVFLPGERDIRETAETLNGRRIPNTEIIPLLASLPAGEQQRAFRLSANRRIILSTNVAETSVTLPGIRYVIDSGLVRLSRYNHRTHVQRLHIEPVSQASANQRRGRCGRLGPGICIRLYDETDFAKRDAYTPPEILRSSLAGVILSMLDLKLGAIESFPFIDPPAPSMIREGYRELDMLGALESIDAGTSSAAPTPHLTHLGQQLARLPLEPALARILFAAHHEKALPDALTIVAALECEDPRRRPMDKQDEADRQHARFLSPVSDFAALIRLWRFYHDQPSRSQSALRRLCKDAFLSYPRMRDWCDLREQLNDLCKTLRLDVTASTGGEEGLHRALLAGLLGNIGQRDPETSEYRGANGLRFALFPGSGLVKAQTRKKEPAPPAPQQPKPRNALPSRDWILAGELVETSRLFARTAACIDPAWIEPVAQRLCKYSYHSPAWDAARGFVRVKERVTLFGLVLVQSRARDYSRINPTEARDIFIREGLVSGAFPKPVPPFLSANLARIRALLDAEEKTRQHGALFDPEKAYTFYDRRLPQTVCSAASLRQWLKEEGKDEKEKGRSDSPPWTDASLFPLNFSLRMSESDLPPLRDLSREFPDAITLSGSRFALSYRHAQGEPDDGVTCAVPAPLLPLAATWRSDWLVPGMLDEKLRWMINVLPSKFRRLLQPADETLAMCRSRLTPGKTALQEALSDAIYAVRGVRIPPESWPADTCPDHLRMRYVALAEDGRELGNGRDLERLIRLFAKQDAPQTADSRLANPWQRDGITSWDFGPLPPQVDVGKAGWPIIHYPALSDQGSTVSLRLFPDPAEAAGSHEQGSCRLFAIALGKEWKRYMQPPSLPSAVAGFLSHWEMRAETLGKDIGNAVLREAFTEDRPAIRDAATFQARLEDGRGQLHNRHTTRMRTVVAILHAASEIESLLIETPLPQPTADDLMEQLVWLIFPGFAASLSTPHLQHLPRYLEACRTRIQRARINPAGDQKKMAELLPLWQRYTQFVGLDSPPRHDKAKLAQYRWLAEEFRVSLFAQELRTPAPVSAKRLDTLWREVILP